MALILTQSLDVQFRFVRFYENKVWRKRIFANDFPIFVHYATGPFAALDILNLARLVTDENRFL